MGKKNVTAVIYARVSTNGQDYDRQLHELRDYASRMGYNVVREFAEKISGAKKVAEREALTELLSFVEANNVDKVLIYECSRLSRRVADFINIVDKLNELHISLIRSRMESGYNNYRNNGGVVGRKVGYKKTDEAMRKEYKEESRLLRKGLSLRNVAKITGTSVNTLRKIKAIC